jgi:uncharacterized protein (TIGR02391 family)
MPVLPRPKRMPLHAAISYVMERCGCTNVKASQTLQDALREDALQAAASKLIPDPDHPRHSGRTVYIGPDLVPAKVWACYPWLEFDTRSSPRGGSRFYERTADGHPVGPVYSNPTIATADIDAWLGREGNQTDRVVRAYRDLDLHPVIGEAANRLYLDGHYASAIEDAVKALNNLVRLRSGKLLDGSDLMKTVFSPRNPILGFNDLEDQSDRDEQEGFMMMFAGAVAGLRNPRAHKLIKDDPEQALEFIAFVSLLAKLLGGAKKA